MSAHIGVQMLTVLPTIKEYGLYETLKKCTEIGLYRFEVSQLKMDKETIDTLLRAKKELNIRIDSMSCLMEDAPDEGDWVNPFDNLTDDYDKIVNDCRTVGCEVLRIGLLPNEAVGSYEGAVAFAQRTEKMAKRLKADGIDLYYHTHHMEFAKHHGKHVLDIIKENAPDVGFELDIHWIQRGGCDPVKTIEDYKGHVRLLHLKDYRINGALFEKSGWSKEIIETAEVGEGNLPIKECIEAGLRSGCEFFFIEQDETYDRTPLEALKISHDNLCAMGYQDMFQP